MELPAATTISVASHGIAAAYAGWLLRSLGAKVEHVTALDLEGLGAFLGEGASTSARPDAAAMPGEVVITDEPYSAAAVERLAALARSRRVVWVTPWGIGNAWSARPESDLALYAASGWMSAVGEPGREPLAAPGAQCRFMAGLFAAIAAVEHLLDGRKPAVGLVDAPVIEALTATLIYDSVAFQYYGATRARVGNRFSATQPLLATLACKDGWIGLHSALHTQWQALARLIGHPELVSDPRFALLADRAANVAELDREYLLPWLAGRTRWEAFHELQGAHIPASAHPDMAEILSSPHFSARGSLQAVTTPSGAAYRVPGSPFRVTAEAGPAAPPAGGGPWRPGAVRVVDLSMGWAGPLVGHNLAALGADVIKIESHRHFDWWRGSRPPGDGDGLGLHERSHVFNTVNRGKRGITLDLASARGREIALDLIASADVVVENFGAGVIEKLGLTYGVLSERNPRLVMLRQPGFGTTGPEASYVAFGNTIEGMSGLTALTGYEGGAPTMLSNACGDPVSGLIGTLAVLGGLGAAAADGRGRLIECAQLEGFLPLVSEALIEYQRTGRVPARRGNRRAGHEPSGAFHLGHDRWLVIDVPDDARWTALATAIGEEWATAPALASSEGRAGRRDAIVAGVEAWARRVGEEAALAACERAGVPASPVLNEAEVLAIEPLAGSGFWQGMDREPVGFHLYPTMAYSLAGERPLAELPAPFLGQHTEEVLSAMGYGAAALARLAAEGITGSVPQPVG